MSEFLNRHNEQTLRRQLLMTVSAFALTVSICIGPHANAEDADRPTVWIELGGQLEGLSSPQEAFSPAFVSTYARYDVQSPLGIQKSPHSSPGLEGNVTFDPRGSDWVFSAGIRYGRSIASRHQHQQTPNQPMLKAFQLPPPFTKYIGPTNYLPTSHLKFADANTQQRESHLILDFRAGKDVGLGIFGAKGSSIVSAGLRFAQFTSKTNVNLDAEPDVRYPTTPITSFAQSEAFKYSTPIHFHNYAAVLDSRRSFHGVGPSLNWDESMPFLGNTEAGEMTFDWGVNGAILFGRQKLSASHHTTIRTYNENGRFSAYASGPHHGRVRLAYGRFDLASSATRHMSGNPNRIRSVVVPNLGGFAGLSMRYSVVKVSLGYRADFFFGAMDGGIDAAKKENVGFHGPFATFSIGLGG